MSDEQARVAEDLRRIRDGVRERALLDAEAGATLPAAETRPARARESAAPAAPEAKVPAPAPPDTAPLNAGWDTRLAGRPGGWKGLLARVVLRALGPTLEAQVEFNSTQVRYDNELLAYVNARIDAIHRHYDAVLGNHGRHMGEMDERHLILQEELVAHVHDLVKRIDLVLSLAERGRLGIDFALRDVKTRLGRLEERLRRA